MLMPQHRQPLPFRMVSYPNPCFCGYRVFLSTFSCMPRSTGAWKCDFARNTVATPSQHRVQIDFSRPYKVKPDFFFRSSFPNSSFGSHNVTMHVSLRQNPVNVNGRWMHHQTQNVQNNPETKTHNQGEWTTHPTVPAQVDTASRVYPVMLHANRKVRGQLALCIERP